MGIEEWNNKAFEGKDYIKYDKLFGGYDELWGIPVYMLFHLANNEDIFGATTLDSVLHHLSKLSDIYEQAKRHIDRSEEANLQEIARLKKENDELKAKVRSFAEEAEAK